MKRDPATARAEGHLADRAGALTVVALLLLTPPLLGIFDRPVLLFGIPLLHFYCYGVWLAAIGFGAWIATRLNSAEGEEVGGDEPIERD